MLCAPSFQTHRTIEYRGSSEPLAKQLLDSTMGSSGGSDRTWQIWQDGLDIERCQEDHRELRSLVIVSP